jgi:hypothetical protein
MIKAIEHLLSRLFFCFFSLNLIGFSLSVRILYKILPRLKERDNSDGFNRYEYYRSRYYRSDSGLGFNQALGMLIGFILILFLTIGIYAFKIIELDFAIGPITSFVVLMVLTFSACYIFVFRNNKYLKYFDQFEQWEKSKLRTNILISMMVYILVFFLSIFAITL